MKRTIMKSLPAIVAFAVVGLAGCASTTGSDGSATGGSSAAGASPTSTQCSPQFAVACRT